MTVQELINKLEKADDKNSQITIAVGQYNKRYPVAYCDVHENGYEHLSYGRIEIHLPSDENKFMYTAERKL